MIDGRKGADILRQRATHAGDARIVHIGQAGVGAFQQRCRRGDVLVAPELAARQFHQVVSLRHQPGVHVIAGNGRDLFTQGFQLFRRGGLLGTRVVQSALRAAELLSQLLFVAARLLLQGVQLVAQALIRLRLKFSLMFPVKV